MDLDNVGVRDLNLGPAKGGLTYSVADGNALIDLLGGVLARLVDHEAALAAQDAKYWAALAAQDEKYGAALAAQDAKYGAALAAQETKYEAALAARDAKCGAALADSTAARDRCATLEATFARQTDAVDRDRAAVAQHLDDIQARIEDLRLEPMATAEVVVNDAQIQPAHLPQPTRSDLKAYVDQCVAAHLARRASRDKSREDQPVHLLREDHQQQPPVPAPDQQHPESENHHQQHTNDGGDDDSGRRRRRRPDSSCPRQDNQQQHDVGCPRQDNQQQHDVGCPRQENQQQHDVGCPRQDNQPKQADAGCLRRQDNQPQQADAGCPPRQDNQAQQADLRCADLQHQQADSSCADHQQQHDDDSESCEHDHQQRHEEEEEEEEESGCGQENQQKQADSSCVDHQQQEKESTHDDAQQHEEENERGGNARDAVVAQVAALDAAVRAIQSAPSHAGSIEELDEKIDSWHARLDPVVETCGKLEGVVAELKKQLQQPGTRDQSADVERAETNMRAAAVLMNDDRLRRVEDEASRLKDAIASLETRVRCIRPLAAPPASDIGSHTPACDAEDLVSRETATHEKDSCCETIAREVPRERRDEQETARLAEVESRLAGVEARMEETVRRAVRRYDVASVVEEYVAEQLAVSETRRDEAPRAETSLRRLAGRLEAVKPGTHLVLESFRDYANSAADWLAQLLDTTEDERDAKRRERAATLRKLATDLYHQLVGPKTDDGPGTLATTTKLLCLSCRRPTTEQAARRAGRPITAHRQFVGDSGSTDTVVWRGGFRMKFSSSVYSRADTSVCSTGSVYNVASPIPPSTGARRRRKAPHHASDASVAPRSPQFH